MKQEEKKLSEGLEEAAEISFDEAYTLTEDYRDFLAKGLTENKPRPIGPHWFCEYAKKRFIAGAEWQEGQFEKNRLAHCNTTSEEDYYRETDFAMEIIENEHRQPTFIDAINYGMRLQKNQMLQDAVEADVNTYKDLAAGKSWAEFVVEMPTNNLGDKVRVIIVKKDQK